MENGESFAAFTPREYALLEVLMRKQCVVLAHEVVEARLGLRLRPDSNALAFSSACASDCGRPVLGFRSPRLTGRALVSAVGLFAALGGLVVTALIVGAMGAMPGPFLAVAGVVALILLAIALPTAGLERLVGAAGVGVAALLFFLIGYPASGNASAPELLPGFWRAVDPLLPPGAGGDAIRGTAYFHGAGTADALTVLGVWALLGHALVAVADAIAKRREADHPPARRPCSTSRPSASGRTPMPWRESMTASPPGRPLCCSCCCSSSPLS